MTFPPHPSLTNLYLFFTPTLPTVVMIGVKKEMPVKIKAAINGKGSESPSCSRQQNGGEIQ
jgi:hypothetical protein